MAKHITSWGDVRAEIARLGVSKTEVAREMGIARTTFGTQINSRDSYGPTADWYARFTTALARVSRETQVAK